MPENWWFKLKAMLWSAVWSANLATASGRRRVLLLYPRIAAMIGRELAAGQIGMRAASLVFTTLLSLVPLLAVSFSLLKGFGVHREMEQMLIGFLAPLGEQGLEISDRIIDFVNNVNVGVLGTIGLMVLVYTVISLLQKIETSFNYAWRVDRMRPVRERVSHYLSAMLVGPLMVFSSLGLTATVLGSTALRDLAAYDPFGVAMAIAGKVATFLLVIAAFTFLYIYMPNARVRLRSAVVGALVAGVLWESANWGFGAFIVGSTRYTAIYSSFAILIVFMLWLYAGWLVLLVGASVSFYHQHPECLGLLRHEVKLSNRLRERVALSATWLIADQHLRGGWPWTAQKIAQRLSVPTEPLSEMLEALQRKGIVLQSATDGPWVPGRDLSELRVVDAIIAVREAFEGPHLGNERIITEPPVEDLAARMEGAAAGVVGELSLRDWVLQATATGDTDTEPGAPPDDPDEVSTPIEEMPPNAVDLRERRREVGGGHKD